MDYLIQSFSNFRSISQVPCAAAFVVIERMWQWGPCNPFMFPWAYKYEPETGTLHLCHKHIEACCIIHMGMHHSPHMLFLPRALAGCYGDVPTREQLKYRSIYDLNLAADF